GIKVLISGANSRVSQKLVKAGIVKLVGEQNVYPVFEGALSAALTEIEAQPTE
ncbi:TPA: sodium-independent anion transporter, partial [Vibrio cholerae O1]